MNPSISPWYPQIFLSPFRMGSYLMASKDSLESLQRLGAPWWMVAAWIVGEPAYEFGYHQITSKCQFYNLGIIKLHQTVNSIIWISSNYNTNWNNLTVIHRVEHDWTCPSGWSNQFCMPLYVSLHIYLILRVGRHIQNSSFVHRQDYPKWCYTNGDALEVTSW